MNYSILITGANGQLGKEFSALSQNSSHNFIFVSKAQLDITNKLEVDEYFKTNTIDICINCAAYTAVDKAESDQLNAIMVNVNGVENLAQACKTNNTFLIHISTDFVFGGQQNFPLKETDPTQPKGVYADTKLQGENRVKAILNDYLIIRTSWLYSSYGHNFVKTMLRLGAERQSLNVVFDQIGTPTYANNLAQAILEIISRGLPKLIENTGIYHYSNEGVASWYDFALEIMQAANLNCLVYPIESHDYQTPAERPFYSVLNKQLIKGTFGIDIPYWKQSLIDCINKINETNDK